MAYIEFKNVKKIYKMGDVKIRALNGVDFKIDKGEFAVVLGPSGAGKSTILNILGGMDTCTTGEITVDGKRIDKYSSRQLTAYRRYDIGFVFQFHHLLPEFTSLENVMIPALINGASESDAKKRAAELLDTLGLAERATHKPSELSGGEQQRVAIARALASGTELILADEPTGNLDSENSRNIVDILLSLAHDEGRCVIVVTHDPEVAAAADVCLNMRDGRLLAAV